MISDNNLSESEADGNQLKEISDLFVHAINTIVTMAKHRVDRAIFSF